MKFISGIAIAIFALPIFSMEHPVTIALNKKGNGKYVIQVSAEKGYAIQKTAPNKIKLTGEDKLKAEPSELKFNGAAKLDKPDYYEKVDDMDVTLTGKGSVEIDARIFYCDLNKGMCYPAKIKRKETIN